MEQNAVSTHQGSIRHIPEAFHASSSLSNLAVLLIDAFQVIDVRSFLLDAVTQIAQRRVVHVVRLGVGEKVAHQQQNLRDALHRFDEKEVESNLAKTAIVHGPIGVALQRAQGLLRLGISLQGEQHRHRALVVAQVELVLFHDVSSEEHIRDLGHLGKLRKTLIQRTAVVLCRLGQLRKVAEQLLHAQTAEQTRPHAVRLFRDRGTDRLTHVSLHCDERLRIVAFSVHDLSQRIDPLAHTHRGLRLGSACEDRVYSAPEHVATDHPLAANHQLQVVGVRIERRQLVGRSIWLGALFFGLCCCCCYYCYCGCFCFCRRDGVGIALRRALVCGLAFGIGRGQPVLRSGACRFLFRIMCCVLRMRLVLARVLGLAFTLAFSFSFTLVFSLAFTLAFSLVLLVLVLILAVGLPMSTGRVC
mmetsp:Transcript_14117/g.42510  ORF Transcript_14117/g.42510 Transcript_14117/m.42510 type:complete len:416 (+) Transcript_14117:366-1613(+)